MNPKLAKFSNENLEKRLATLLKFQKFLNVVVIGALLLTILMFLFEGNLEFNLGSPISILVLGLILKYIVYPIQIGTIKNEINKRNSINNQNINQTNQEL